MASCHRSCWISDPITMRCRQLRTPQLPGFAHRPVLLSRCPSAILCRSGAVQLACTTRTAELSRATGPCIPHDPGWLPEPFRYRQSLAATSGQNATYRKQRRSLGPGPSNRPTGTIVTTGTRLKRCTPDTDKKDEKIALTAITTTERSYLPIFFIHHPQRSLEKQVTFGPEPDSAGHVALRCL